MEKHGLYVDQFLVHFIVEQNVHVIFKNFSRNGIVPRSIVLKVKSMMVQPNQLKPWPNKNAVRRAAIIEI